MWAPTGQRSPLGIARAVGVDVFEVVQLIRGDAAGGAVGVGRQRERDAVAPASADLGGEEFGVDLVFFRLQEIFEADDVGLDHLEDGEAAVEAEFAGLGDDVVFGVVLQDEEPGVAWLLVIGRVVARGRRGWWSC